MTWAALLKQQANLHCFDISLLKVWLESKRPHTKLEFGDFFFHKKTSVATFFTPVGVLGGKKESNQREVILAMILEKH